MKPPEIVVRHYGNCFILTQYQASNKIVRISSDVLNENQRNLLNLQLVTLTQAEREGFEPPVPLSTPVFKTGAFDHSAISPLDYFTLMINMS